MSEKSRSEIDLPRSIRRAVGDPKYRASLSLHWYLYGLQKKKKKKTQDTRLFILFESRVDMNVLNPVLPRRRACHRVSWLVVMP